MADVIDISQFLRRTEPTVTGLAEVSDDDGLYQQPWLVESVGAGTGQLSAAVLRKLNPDTQLVRFLEVVEKAMALVERCTRELSDEDTFAADDSFMAAKPAFAELLMFRDLPLKISSTAS